MKTVQSLMIIASFVWLPTKCFSIFGARKEHCYLLIPKSNPYNTAVWTFPNHKRSFQKTNNQREKIKKLLNLKSRGSYFLSRLVSSALAQLCDTNFTYKLKANWFNQEDLYHASVKRLESAVKLILISQENTEVTKKGIKPHSHISSGKLGKNFWKIMKSNNVSGDYVKYNKTDEQIFI